MAISIERYSRALAPSNPQSVKSYLDNETLKLERTVNSVVANSAVTSGPNIFKGDQTIEGVLFVKEDLWLSKNITLQRSIDDYTLFDFRDKDNNARLSIYGGTASDHTAYFDADRILLEDLAEANVYADLSKDAVKLKTNNADRIVVTDTGANVIGTLKVGGVKVTPDNTQPAIADDASGSGNEATVNAILAALRANNIIAP